MNEPLVSDELLSASFIKEIEEIDKYITQSSSKIYIEGLRYSSRAFFLARLAQSISRTVIVLTPNHKTAERLIGDLKYFSDFINFDKKICFFPSWELKPYENISPPLKIMGERLDVLRMCQREEVLLLIVPVQSIMQCVIPRQELDVQTFSIKSGENFEREFLETCLVDNGFVRSSLVEERGHFSVRGDIVDFYPPTSTNPLRIEFFDNTIEYIREFDINTQISMKNIQWFEVLPVKELSLSSVQKEIGLRKILKYAEDEDVDRTSYNELIDKIKHFDSFFGLEPLAPFFYGSRETLFEYFSKDSLVILDEEVDVISEVNKFSQMINAEYKDARKRGDIAALPGSFYLKNNELESCLAEHKLISINSLNDNLEDMSKTIAFDVKQNPPFFGKFEVFAEKTKRLQARGNKVIVVAPTKGQINRVQDLSIEYDLDFEIDKGFLSCGFSYFELGLTFVAEHEIFGQSFKHRYRKNTRLKSFQRGLKDLKPGDYLVHVDYGIGRYNGIRELETGNVGGEFLNITYSADEKLYVPMDGLASIQKYMGSGDIPPLLDKLGGVGWKKKKETIKESIRELAEDLLKLYASRKIVEGISYSSNSILMQEFSDSFEFEETEDQLKAIDDIMNDLESNKPMDRLVCGDVGYGKTEVAMRAALKVVLDKKQVAILVPTTVLAQQHLITFKERFQNYALNIEMVNRFKSPREQKQIITKVKNGEVDIIIGTHRLLSKDIDFAQLGLIIIDEEQRFGVKHKEALKKIRNKIDILALTATPIPRTLHFSLMGVRDLSVIETPPVDRLSIKTFVRKFDEKIIHDSIKKELRRGGQVYFVHNEIYSMNSIKELIQKIVPEARIGVGHGQLPEHQLEEVMGRFILKELDVLLCTTIIESGLDIPSANTIIINRADHFGLAQLYQLRGRVGRFKHQAYAYLLTPGVLSISSEARQRLNSIEELSELGSGFQLAARDMEIRGVGNMLGRKQSGHIASIGFDLYSNLIEETVKELRGEKVQNQLVEPEIDLQLRGFIPKSYIPELNQRLDIYRRLQLLDNLEDFNEIKHEIIDRFGKLTENVEKLLFLVTIKTICKKLHIKKVYILNDEVRLNVESTTPISPEKIFENFEGGFVFVSEYCLSLKIKRKRWREDMLSIINKLKSVLRIVENE